MNIEKLEARVADQKNKFAGWFSELKSGMAYRLWEQGGYEYKSGEVGLYESSCGLSHEEAAALLAVVRAARAVESQCEILLAMEGVAQDHESFAALRAALRALEELE